MSAEDLIEMLKKCHPKAEVKTFDADSGQVESVTGMTYGGADNIVELYTDEP